MGLLLVPLIAVGSWAYLQLHPRGGPGERVVVTVQPGWGTSQIGDELARRGVIGSGLVFRLWERNEQFTAGVYELNRNMGISDAAAAMRSGPHAAPQVGVLPGLTLDEVGDRVAGIKRFSKDRFMGIATDGEVRSVFQPAGINTLEGVLWPDSYPVRADETELELTASMVEAFDDHATKLGIVDSAARLGISPYEVIIVASLVQREAKLDEDRPLIAAVIFNRLRDGMPLQIDATTQYARAGRQPGVRHLQDPCVAADTDLHGQRELAARRDAPGRRAVPLLRALRRQRQARVLADVRGAPPQRRGRPRQGSAVSTPEPRAITARTVVAGVIGDPVAHSLSPAIHNAAYRALGLDWVYVGLPVPAGRGHEAIRALPALGIAGVNVTMPHKADAADACDVLTGDAAALGAVNTVVVRPDGSLLGDSTDGAGFLLALSRIGVDPAASRILVLGAGGAARSIVLALGRAGARVMVAARRGDAAGAAAELATGAEAHDWSDLATLVARCDVIVNATPIGMSGEASPVDPIVDRAPPRGRRHRVPPGRDPPARRGPGPGRPHGQRARDAPRPGRPRVHAAHGLRSAPRRHGSSHPGPLSDQRDLGAPLKGWHPICRQSGGREEPVCRCRAPSTRSRCPRSSSWWRSPARRVRSRCATRRAGASSTSPEAASARPRPGEL